MTKKTSFDFGGKDSVAAAVDRFAPPDSKGKLKKLRDELLKVLPDRKNLSAVEAADLIAYNLFAAGLNSDEIDYAVTRLFINNEYFKDAMVNIVKTQISMYPSVEADNGQSVYVGVDPAVNPAVELTPEESLKVFGELSVDIPVDAPTDTSFTVATEAVDAEDHSVILTTEDQTYQEIQESNDAEIAAMTKAAVVEEIVEDVVDFGQMKLPALKKYAAEHNIDLTGLSKKPEIVARLIEMTQTRGEY